MLIVPTKNSSMLRVFLIISFLFANQVPLLAQNFANTDGLTKMDKGSEAMLDGKYEEADNLLRQAMQSIDKLPSELAYYFGRNSYHIGKYKQAINWLNKYIELKGTSGQYFDACIKYLELANTEYLVVRQQEVSEVEEQFTTDRAIECEHDNVVCPVCKGSGVLITQGTFEQVYKTCPYSGLKGMLSCDDYNLFLKGQLQPRTE